MNIIQENLSKYMEDPYTNIVTSGSYKVLDFINLNKVLNNTTEDFLIFDNCGGKKFEIMFDRFILNENKIETFKVKDFVEYLLKNEKNWIYCYQIDNKQIILRKIIN